MRSDLLKTSFMFVHVVKAFKSRIKKEFRFNESKFTKDTNFTVLLKGDVGKTSKVFKYVFKRTSLNCAALYDKVGVPHNGCRKVKRKRKKNRGRNRFSRKRVKF